MGGDQAACLACSAEKCVPEFEVCAGVPFKQPDLSDETVLCTDTGGEWTNDTCVCGPGKVWDADNGCVDGAPDPKELLCTASGGNWANDVCDCGPDKEWSDVTGCTTPAPSPDEALCTLTGGNWANDACDCGPDKNWDANLGCQNSPPPAGNDNTLVINEVAYDPVSYTHLTLPTKRIV